MAGALKEPCQSENVRRNEYCPIVVENWSLVERVCMSRLEPAQLRWSHLVGRFPSPNRAVACYEQWGALQVLCVPWSVWLCHRCPTGGVSPVLTCCLQCMCPYSTGFCARQRNWHSLRQSSLLSHTVTLIHPICAKRLNGHYSEQPLLFDGHYGGTTTAVTT